MLTAHIDQNTGAVHVLDDDNELVAIGKWPAGWHITASTSQESRRTLAAEARRRPLFTLNLAPVEQ
jgi:hypothetical protein